MDWQTCWGAGESTGGWVLSELDHPYCWCTGTGGALFQAPCTSSQVCTRAACNGIIGGGLLQWQELLLLLQPQEVGHHLAGQLCQLYHSWLISWTPS